MTDDRKRPRPDMEQADELGYIPERFITEADSATNRTGISEDIDNQVFIEMNSR